jgi:hypothetical protein
MYFQFLIEDQSTEILVNHVICKLQEHYPEYEIYADVKSFSGIGHFTKSGSTMERKTGKLLNDLPKYLRGIDKKLRNMGRTAAIIIVLDNDNRDPEAFYKQLEQMASDNGILTDHVFCVAVKEMEAWLLGDPTAIEKAYPEVRKTMAKNYVQDGICDTWEVLANMVYPGGLTNLKKKAGRAYTEIGKAKAEWADRIGAEIHLEGNHSPSFRFFVQELVKRIEAA